MQFVQVGNGAEAVQLLKMLDDELSYQAPNCRTIKAHKDIVDTTQYDPRHPLSALKLLKLFLGGIDRKRDKLQLQPHD